MAAKGTSFRDTWGLHTHHDAIAAYQLVQDSLRRDVIGHEDALRLLAVAGVRHLLGAQGQRLLLAGPHGVGKSTMLRALANALEIPFAVLDITMMSEANWHGYDLPRWIGDLVSNHGDRAERALLLLDEADKLACGSTTGVGSDYRRGKQQSLLPLLGVGSPIPIDGIQYDASGALVVMAGVFDGLPCGRATPGDLVQLGLMPELVERFGSIIRLKPLEIHEQAEMFSRALQPIAESYALFGYALTIPGETLHYAAHRMRVSDWGPRSAAALLSMTATRALTTLLDGAALPGERVVLTPDDIGTAMHSAPRPDGGEIDPIWAGA